MIQEGLYVGRRLCLVPLSIIPDKKSEEELNMAKLPCEVIYINEEHRYFRVRFECKNGYTFTESFKFSLPGDSAAIVPKGYHLEEIIKQGKARKMRT